MGFSIKTTDALIVVDIQNDFLPGGTLAVPEGDQIIPNVNHLMKKFSALGGRVILTQDWHPSNHLSFASQHPGKNSFDPIEGIAGIGPVLWPDHCVRETTGAAFSSQLDTGKAHLILRKGLHRSVDSYSAFTENDQKTETGLAGYLENAGLKRIFICGLALDYCVAWSAMDGAKKGFETCVLPDLCRGIAPESVQTAEQGMKELGILFISPGDIT
ncbi:MAG: bifunctional nicotinamidase/pyrazinamidase [Deltaproteobacteria bacterium]|nr:bifunctional nicotinamidase/pyrazinamidase [Deltaproteobacteria bacterium]